MKCILNSNIQSISGKVGGTLFKTFKRPNGKTETRAYFLPKRENGKYGYERKAPLTEKEVAARLRFKQAMGMYNAMSEDEKRTYALQWRARQYMFNGKKYLTLRGYIFAHIYDEMEKRQVGTNS